MRPSRPSSPSRASLPSFQRRRSYAAWIILAGLILLTLGLLWRGGQFYMMSLDARVDHRDFHLLRPHEWLGHGYGVVGTALILTNLLYLARRSLAWLPLGAMSRWLDVHVFTGIAGSLLVLFHSAFQLRTPIATVTSVSLAVVVVTGLAGRYLYAVVLRPGATSLGQRLAEMRATLPDFAKAVQEALLACPTSRLPPNASLLRTLATIPKWALQARARRGVVKRVAADHPELMELRETEPRAVTRFVREISWEAGRDVDRSMGEAMLRSWRGVHRLMALLFVFSVVVHVGVALKFGYWWVFSLSEGAVP